MNTEHHYRDRREKPISLNSSETAHLERPHAGEEITITVKSGIIRIAAKQSKNIEDITLAFACKVDTFKFHYPEDLEITIEAETNTTYFVECQKETESNTSDAIMDWIIQLHIVRHEANLERRLMKFFELLMTRLGKRTAEGLLLEHTLSHARIAEIIGSTRSTVSRTISALRKTQKIYIDELKNRSFYLWINQRPQRQDPPFHLEHLDFLQPFFLLTARRFSEDSAKSIANQFNNNTAYPEVRTSLQE